MRRGSRQKSRSNWSQTAKQSILNGSLDQNLAANPLAKANSLEFLQEGAVMANVLPETLEDGADMVPYSELIIELTGGSSMLNI